MIAPAFRLAYYLVKALYTRAEDVRAVPDLSVRSCSDDHAVCVHCQGL